MNDRLGSMEQQLAIANQRGGRHLPATEEVAARRSPARVWRSRVPGRWKACRETATTSASRVPFQAWARTPMSRRWSRRPIGSRRMTPAPRTTCPIATAATASRTTRPALVGEFARLQASTRQPGGQQHRVALRVRVEHRHEPDPADFDRLGIDLLFLSRLVRRQLRPRLDDLRRRGLRFRLDGLAQQRPDDGGVPEATATETNLPPVSDATQAQAVAERLRVHCRPFVLQRQQRVWL